MDNQFRSYTTPVPTTVTSVTLKLLSRKFEAAWNAIREDPIRVILFLNCY